MVEADYGPIDLLLIINRCLVRINNQAQDWTEVSDEATKWRARPRVPDRPRVALGGLWKFWNIAGDARDAEAYQPPIPEEPVHNLSVHVLHRVQ